MIPVCAPPQIPNYSTESSISVNDSHDEMLDYSRFSFGDAFTQLALSGASGESDINRFLIFAAAATRAHI
jgi:hypothetical protein